MKCADINVMSGMLLACHAIVFPIVTGLGTCVELKISQQYYPTYLQAVLGAVATVAWPVDGHFF
eukprot:1159885-Pelagomonas_calceolata.AAC.5